MPPKRPAPSPPLHSPVAPPAISDAEWIVMQVVWNQGTATANQVVAALEPKTDWKPKTIHTLLRRLAQKHALAFDKVGREFQYRPLVEAERCTHAAARSFLERFFGGQVAPFLSCLLDREKLSAAEIAQLRRLLDEKGS